MMYDFIMEAQYKYKTIINELQNIGARITIAVYLFFWNKIFGRYNYKL